MTASHRSLVVVLWIAWVAPPAQAAPEASREHGAALYAELCIDCHGAGGRGGRYGPSLVDASTRALSDAELRGLVGRGRSNGGMPGFLRDVGAGGVALLAAHVRRLQGVPESEIRLPEDLADAGPPVAVVRGEVLFRGKARCLDCHSISDEGGLLGPDLTDVAARLSPDAIREAVLEPAKSIAPGFDAVTIVTAGGRRLYGRVRREGAETLQLFDADELLWTTYFKRQLRSIERSRESLMPDEVETLLDPEELEDLLAFLATLE